MPEFIKFTGEDSRTTWKHISQFNTQIGIYGSLDHLKIRMFPKLDIYHRYLTDMWGSHESMTCGSRWYISNFGIF